MSIKLEYRDVLLRPILTEKTTTNMANRTYTFEVHRDSNKRLIKDAIENIYEVRVEKINVLNVKPKPKRRGMSRGKTRSWKKAMVKLQEGYTIPDLENLY
jgi:large subunit ribosomal protein L23